MSLIDDLLAAYHRPVLEAQPVAAPASAATTPASIPAGHGPPTAILTCMDARVDPARLLGPETGGGSLIAVIRNAGGRASDDAVRSLIIATRLRGVRNLLVVHHTDCAMLTFTNEAMHRRLAAEIGADTTGFDFLPITTLHRSVQEDVARLSALPFFAGTISISGYIYHLETGRLDPVPPQPPADTAGVATDSTSAVESLAYRAGRALGQRRPRR
ncbi:MAG: carbonic anhydrase [Chloroflexi bacterium]|nr:carbonic anhydrase [Chloroflexota bacterium]